MNRTYRKLLEFFDKQVTKGQFKSPNAFAKAAGVKPKSVYEILERLRVYEQEGGEEGAFQEWAGRIAPRKIRDMWRNEVEDYIDRVGALDEAELLETPETPQAIKDAIIEVRNLDKSFKGLETFIAKRARKQQSVATVSAGIAAMYDTPEEQAAALAQVREMVLEGVGRTPNSDKFIGWLADLGVKFVLPEGEELASCGYFRALPELDPAGEVPLSAEVGFSRTWLEQFGAPVTFRVTGEEMNPTLLDGDLVLVDRGSTEVGAWGLYLVAIEGRPTVRRLGIAPGALVVRCDNPVYGSLQLSKDQEGFDVLGKVVWFGRNSL